MVLRLPIEYRNQFVHISNVVKFSMRPITTDRVLLRIDYTFAFPSMIYPLVGLKFKFTLYADEYRDPFTITEICSHQGVVMELPAPTR